MNCQEYRDMIEDALDISLHVELETHVRRHLEHCEGCRRYFVRRRTEHVSLFRSVNAAYSHMRPPPDGFAGRIVHEVETRRNAHRGWRWIVLPRWALMAASLVLMAGFVFAAVTVAERVVFDMPDSTEEDETAWSGAFNVSDSVDGDVLGATTPLMADNQLITQQGENEMNIKQKAATVLLTAMASSLDAGIMPEYKISAPNGIRGEAMSATVSSIMLSSPVSETEYTYEWKTGEYPTSIHDGRIVFEYTDDNKIKKLKINSVGGERFVFTGDKIVFTDTAANNTAYIENTTYNTLVFQNEASLRTFMVSTPNFDKTWHGYSNFVDADYVTILENANVDDYEPDEVLQDSYDQNGEWIPCWSSINTMYPVHIVREPGRITFQYQTYTADYENRKLVKVIKAELKQIGADIKMRTIAAYSVFSDAAAPINRGFDVDTLWIGEDKEEKPLRTTGVLNYGYGINTVKLKYVGTRFLVRFEGAITVTGCPAPIVGTRIELANVANVNNTAYPSPAGGVIAFLDGSKEWLSWIPTDSSSSGSFLFATTKPTASPAVTNLIDIAGTWMTKASFVVKGIEGYPMVLRVWQNALPTNSSVIVKKDGILRLKATSPGVATGVRGGMCDFTVEKGGVLQQAAWNVFGTNTMVTLNGGTLMLGVDYPNGTYNVATDIPQLTLRSGAMLSSVDNMILCLGQTPQGATWYVGGESPSTNNVALQFYGPANVVVTNTFNVARIGDSYADFVCNKGIGMYTGSEQSRTNVLRKVGLGTMLLKDNYTVPADVLIEGGTLKLGASAIWRGYCTLISPSNSYYNPNDPPPPIVLYGGTLAAAANTSNGLGRVTLTTDSGITLEEGACFTCYDQSSVSWNADAQLAVTIPTNSIGSLLGSIRFGTSVNGLTDDQLSSIRINGKRAMLNHLGWLQYRQIGARFIIR